MVISTPQNFANNKLITIPQNFAILQGPMISFLYLGCVFLHIKEKKKTDQSLIYYYVPSSSITLGLVCLLETYPICVLK